MTSRSRYPTQPHRSGEPYRLAVSGIYSRLAATALKLNIETSRPPVGAAEPYAGPADLARDLDVLHASLVANNSLVIARGRLRHLRRAVDCFGFHLATLDIAYFEQHRSGEIMSRSTNDLLQVRLLLGFGVLNMVNVVFAFASALQIMLRISGRLTLVSFVMPSSSARTFDCSISTAELSRSTVPRP